MSFDEDDETLYIYKGGDAHFPSQGFPTGGAVPRKVQRAKISPLTDSIGKLAFFKCTMLESITIPESITRIDDGAFKGCTKLTSIKIPSSVTSIGAGAFFECTSLQSVDIPDSITSISIAAFYGCSSLPTIRLPSSITRIGKSAFQGCSSLSAIRIPENVTLIGENAFDGCKALLALSVPSSSKKLDGGDDDNHIYHQYQNDLKVGDGAFCNCPCLEVVRKGEEKSCEMCLEEHECFKGCHDFHRLCNNDELKINDIEGFLMTHEDICTEVDSSGRTGLHVLAFNPSVTVKAINLLLDYYPIAAQITDGNGLHPLHYLCMNESVTVDMVIPLINSYPDALKAEGKHGVPLKLALWNNVSMDVIEILYSHHPVGEDKVRFEDKSTLHRLKNGIDEEPKENQIAERWKKMVSVEEPSHRRRSSVESVSVDLSSDLPTATRSASVSKHHLMYRRTSKAAPPSVRNASFDTNENRPNKVKFMDRYSLEMNPPIHKSATCLVLKANDEKPTLEYRANYRKYASTKKPLSKRNFKEIIKALGLRIFDGKTIDDCFYLYDTDNDGRISEEQFINFCKQEVVDWNHGSVAFKFMKDEAHFEREKGPRVGLSSKYVVSLKAYYVQKNNENLAFLDHEKYPYVVLMPFAERNLDSVFRNERPNEDKIRDYILQITRAVEHLHQKGIIHGDLKLLNIVRLRGRLMLIDFDASAKIAGGIDESSDGCYYAGNKFSSGIIPPEMICCIKEQSHLKLFYEYFKNEEQKDDVQWQKIKPKYTSSESEAYVVKTFKTSGSGSDDPQPVDPDQLPYELVKATPAFDAWSLGTILYALLTGENLFPVNRDDNIKDVHSMKKLCRWNTKSLKGQLQKVPDISVRAKDLLSQLLHPDPLQRPSMEEVAKHAFFEHLSDLKLQLNKAKEKDDAELIETLETKIRNYEEEEKRKPPKVEPTLKPEPQIVSAEPVQRPMDNGVESNCGCIIQ